MLTYSIRNSTLFISTKNFISLYKKYHNKKNKLDKQDFLIIDDTSKMINGYFNFFKTIKKGGKLTSNQNSIYEKLGILVGTLENFNNYLTNLTSMPSMVFPIMPA